MDIEHFAAFERARDSGLKEQATRALGAFIASFTGPEEMRAWSRVYVEQFSGHEMRHELYEQVVFPALLDGYGRNEIWALRGLLRTLQNLYQARALWEQVDWISEYTLMKECLALEPDNPLWRAEMLDVLISDFRYSVHEWPAGILAGHNGADAEQCRAIEQDVAEARSLETAGRFTVFLDDFESKLGQYMQRVGA